MKKLTARFITAFTAVILSFQFALPVNAAPAVSKNLTDIADACSTQAACETDRTVCVIEFCDEENPYDIYYDYGEEYEKYIDACDWDLVFDADYYAETFPMLALQYHNDAGQLLKHFQTVGVHEGRQGSKDFNVGAYLQNCDAKVYRAFKTNYAAYYIYYMLNYSSEKNVNTKTADNGKTVYQQYTAVLNWFQKAELERINGYREDEGADPVVFDSELAAFANYRTYNNTVEGYEGHDWTKENAALVSSYFTDAFGVWNHAGENCVKNAYRSFRVPDYKQCRDHYEGMVNPINHYVGISTRNWDEETNANAQCDIYLDTLTDALHP